MAALDCDNCIVVVSSCLLACLLSGVGSAAFLFFAAWLAVASGFVSRVVACVLLVVWLAPVACYCIILGSIGCKKSDLAGEIP